MAHTVLQLLSYAHDNHERPYMQVGMDRLQKIGALTDHFAPHDCSLQPKEVRKDIASAGEQGPENEKLSRETRKPTREAPNSQKANGSVAFPRQTNAVYPINTNSASDADEKYRSADASHSATSPTASSTEAVGLARYKEENNSEDHTRCRYLRHYLNLHWASFTNMFRRQPIDHIREYFGESIAWYFAWAGKILSTVPVPCTTVYKLNTVLIC